MDHGDGPLIYPGFGHPMLDNNDHFQELYIRALADTAPFALWMTGQDGKVVYFNKRWLEFTGRPMALELGDGWTECVHPEDIVRVYTTFMSCIDQRISFKLEYRIKRYDDTFRWIIATGSPRYSSSKHYLGYVGTCLDVTEMWHCRHEILTFSKQQRPKKQDTSDFFSVVIKSLAFTTLSSVAVMFRIDKENPFLIRVEQTYNIQLQKGLTIELPQNFWAECINAFGSTYDADMDNYFEPPPSPGTDCPISEMIQMVQDSRTLLNIRHSVYSTLYQTFFFPLLARFGIKSITTEYIKGSGHIPFGFICMGSVTEKEYTAGEQNTLRVMTNVVSAYAIQEEERIAAQVHKQVTSFIASTSPNGIITVDSNGEIIEMNKSAMETFSFDPATPLPPNTPYIAQNQNGEEKFVETVGIKATGHHVSLELMVKSFNNFYILVLKDLSKLRNLEKAELLAKKSVQESTEKTMFLSKISHEIRNPLNCIINMAEILLDTSMALEQKDIIETIHMAGNNLRTLVDDVLDLAKIESGKLELKNEPFRIRECLEQSLAMMAPTAQKKCTELALFVEPSVPDIIIGDNDKLRQVLINLIGNGVKFTDGGNVIVSVTAQGSGTASRHRRVSSLGVCQTNDHPMASANSTDDDITCTNFQDEQGESLEIFFRIKDTGIGIPTDKIDKLFSNFTQVYEKNGSGGGQYGGTGLGLAICRNIIEVMGGHISVESEYGKGSVVTFSLHALTPPPSEPVPLPLPSFQIQRRKSLLDYCSDKRILIIAKNELVRQMITNYARTLLFEVNSLFSLHDDSPKLKRSNDQVTNYDIIIIDYPYETSIPEFSTRLQMVKSQLNVPIVLLIPITFTHQNTLSVYVDSFLTKPVKSSNFQETIFKLLLSNTQQHTFDPQLSSKLPLNILSVEDNEMNQKMLTMLFSRHGYTIDQSSNGVDALKLLEKKKYDFIFLDIEMAEMNGLECAKIICARYPPDQRPHLIALTGRVLPNEIQECMSCGMIDYLAKPVKMDRLIEILKKWYQ
eukprot:gene14264-16838_t